MRKLDEWFAGMLLIDVLLLFGVVGMLIGALIVGIVQTLGPVVP